MNPKNLKKKFSSTILALVFLLQSCVVYQKKTVSIDEAVASNNKVLILRTNETKLRLKEIEQIDGKIYGIYRVKGENIKVPIAESDIKTIRIQSKSASTWGTIGIVAGSLLAVGITIIAISLQDGLVGVDSFTIPLN